MNLHPWGGGGAENSYPKHNRERVKKYPKNLTSCMDVSQKQGGFKVNITGKCIL